MKHLQATAFVLCLYSFATSGKKTVRLLKKHVPFQLFQLWCTKCYCWKKKKADFVTKENQINFKDYIKSFTSKARKI